MPFGAFAKKPQMTDAIFKRVCYTVGSTLP